MGNSKEIRDVADELDEVAEISEREHDPDDETVPTDLVRPRAAREPSESFSVRIPVSQLRKLRKIAEDQQTTPSTLIRKWVQERLDVGRHSEPATTMSPDLEAAVMELAASIARSTARESFTEHETQRNTPTTHHGAWEVERVPRYAIELYNSYSVGMMLLAPTTVVPAPVLPQRFGVQMTDCNWHALWPSPLYGGRPSDAEIREFRR